MEGAEPRGSWVSENTMQHTWSRMCRSHHKSMDDCYHGLQYFQIRISLYTSMETATVRVHFFMNHLPLCGCLHLLRFCMTCSRSCLSQVHTSGRRSFTYHARDPESRFHPRLSVNKYQSKPFTGHDYDNCFPGRPIYVHRHIWLRGLMIRTSVGAYQGADLSTGHTIGGVCLCVSTLEIDDSRAGEEED